jgi:hypothetical protein
VSPARDGIGSCSRPDVPTWGVSFQCAFPGCVRLHAAGPAVGPQFSYFGMSEMPKFPIIALKADVTRA